MVKTSLMDDELWKRVEADRLCEERLREPYLAAFRATQEEIELCRAEEAQEQPFGDRELSRFGEGLARSGREAVRFERYLVRQGFYPNVAKDDSLGDKV